MPDRIVLLGVEGVGKSTWAQHAPSPVFIAPEDGVRHLDVASFRNPAPETYAEVLACIASLRDEPHDYRTLVIDTLDWLEPMLQAHVCCEMRWPNIEAPGYGKGYVAAAEEWRSLLATVDALRNARDMEVILVAHVGIKMFSNPSGPDYSRYEPLLHKHAGALVKQWADAVFFATFVEYAEDIKGKMKGVSTGARIMHTERSASWDAKNRMSLPPELPLDYDEFVRARAASSVASPDILLDRIAAATASAHLTDDEAAKLAVYVAENINNAHRLSAVLNRLVARNVTAPNDNDSETNKESE